ncbi:selenocysteine insertion sequence-binding protein 2 isoform X2 [Bombina bombina]|uniref:selenocysteine insertion sequence-binding protein 2 isoform X2 n=1 Tax=Bombina bombina TaxID=8345 RepID=UPI00235A7E7B|nr:selenocysteine insertion sequence-binding protein 2 isoform X2 [Bombina bombina]
MMQSVDLVNASSDSVVTQMSWASKLKQSQKNAPSLNSSLSPCSPLSSNRKEQTTQVHKKVQLTRNLATEAEMEEVVVKKRKRKKKKNNPSPKINPQDAEAPQNENLIVQEPPKFQDDEEFPDLASSFGGADRNLRFGPLKSHSYSQPRHGLETVKTKGGGRKSKELVQLNLGGMLAALEQKQHSEKAKQSAKPLVFSVGGGVPVISREPAAITKRQQSKPSLTPHNPLDSSAPLVKKGKQREVPKPKKPTSLKKIILKEREERKLRQSSVTQDEVSTSKDIFSEEVECSTENQVPSEESLLVLHNIEEVSRCVTDTPETTADDLTEDHPDATEVHSPSPLHTSNLPKIHSRRFREYCSQVLSKEVDSCATDLLKELVRFQDRLYMKDPIKAKTKRRLVMGLREVLKHLKLRRLKCIIISPNCEKIQSKGGLDDTLQTIIGCACEQNVPFVFALNRKALGRCVNKAVPVSIVGIFSYDGAQDHFHKLYELTMQARQSYKDMISALQEQQTENESSETKVELSLENSQPRVAEVSAVSAAEETDEPNYIKIWKRMLEEEYKPYALSLEDNIANDMVNLHL